MHGFNQIVIDAHIDVLALQRPLEATLITARAAEKHVLFDVPVIGRRDGIGQADVRFIIALESAAAKFPVVSVQNHAVHTVREGNFPALSVVDFAELNIGVVNHGKNILELRIHLAAHCKQRLFLFR